MVKIRTRAEIRRMELMTLRRDVYGGYLGVQTPIGPAYEAWRAMIGMHADTATLLALRAAATREALATIDAELASLSAGSEPEITAGLSMIEQAYYLRHGGISVVAWSERLPGFPACVPASMSGHHYMADGRILTLDEAAARARIAPERLPVQPGTELARLCEVTP